MAITNTTYLGLNKPDYDAIADIEVLNDNADIIDEQFDGTHLVSKVNNVTPVGGAVTIDLGVTSVNGMTGAVTITERSVKQLIDIIYPVGSYYETTNANFNPNTAWAGTTWQRISDGRTLIAGGGSSGYTVGSTYGAKTHSITTSEMPQHNHTATVSSDGAHSHTTSSAGAHTHTVTGGNDDDHSGHFTIGNSTNMSATTNSAGAHTHSVSTASDHSHTVTIGKTGSGTAMSLLQPSQAVARWLRTA